MKIVNQLLTDRLSLEPLSLLDTEIFHFTNTDAFVRKHLWDDALISLESSRDILQKVELIFNEQAWGLWKIRRKADQRYMGYAGLWRFFEEQQPQLLYALLKENTGHGYASEAAKAIMKYAFEKLNFSHLYASMDKANLSSVKLCEKLGLKFVRESIENDKVTCFYKIKNSDFSRAM